MKRIISALILLSSLIFTSCEDCNIYYNDYGVVTEIRSINSYAVVTIEAPCKHNPKYKSVLEFRTCNLSYRIGDTIRIAR